MSAIITKTTIFFGPPNTVFCSLRQYFSSFQNTQWFYGTQMNWSNLVMVRLIFLNLLKILFSYQKQKSKQLLSNVSPVISHQNQQLLQSYFIIPFFSREE